LENDVVNYPEESLVTLSPELRELQGLSTTAVAALLQATTPDIKAIPFMDLDAFERYQRITS
jgi:hypothetical protein